jgi:hypothetical protein
MFSFDHVLNQERELLGSVCRNEYLESINRSFELITIYIDILELKVRSNQFNQSKS